MRQMSSSKVCSSTARISVWWQMLTALCSRTRRASVSSAGRGEKNSLLTSNMFEPYIRMTFGGVPFSALPLTRTHASQLCRSSAEPGFQPG
jgi:hypothetical protein